MKTSTSDTIIITVKLLLLLTIYITDIRGFTPTFIPTVSTIRMMIPMIPHTSISNHRKTKTLNNYKKPINHYGKSRHFSRTETLLNLNLQMPFSSTTATTDEDNILQMKLTNLHEKLEHSTAKQLRDICKRLEIKSYGVKRDLVFRILKKREEIVGSSSDSKKGFNSREDRNYKEVWPEAPKGKKGGNMGVNDHDDFDDNAYSFNDNKIIIDHLFRQTVHLPGCPKSYNCYIVGHKNSMKGYLNGGKKNALSSQQDEEVNNNNNYKTQEEINNHKANLLLEKAAGEVGGVILFPSSPYTSSSYKKAVKLADKIAEDCFPFIVCVPIMKNILVSDNNNGDGESCSSDITSSEELTKLRNNMNYILRAGYYLLDETYACSSVGLYGCGFVGGFAVDYLFGCDDGNNDDGEEEDGDDDDIINNKKFEKEGISKVMDFASVVIINPTGYNITSYDIKRTNNKATEEGEVGGGVGDNTTPNKPAVMCILTNTQPSTSTNQLIEKLTSKKNNFKDLYIKSLPSSYEEEEENEKSEEENDTIFDLLGSAWLSAHKRKILPTYGGVCK